jgi:hypothetical protein
LRLRPEGQCGQQQGARAGAQIEDAGRGGLNRAGRAAKASRAASIRVSLSPRGISTAGLTTRSSP